VTIEVWADLELGFGVCGEGTQNFPRPLVTIRLCEIPGLTLRLGAAVPAFQRLRRGSRYKSWGNARGNPLPTTSRSSTNTPRNRYDTRPRSSLLRADPNTFAEP